MLGTHTSVLIKENSRKCYYPVGQLAFITWQCIYIITRLIEHGESQILKSNVVEHISTFSSPVLHITGEKAMMPENDLPRHTGN